MIYELLAGFRFNDGGLRFGAESRGHCSNEPGDAHFFGGAGGVGGELVMGVTEFGRESPVRPP